MNDFLEMFAAAFIHDFLRYFLAAGLVYLIFWILGKKRWHHRIIQKKFPKLSKVWFEFRYSMSTVIIFSLNGVVIYQLILADLTTLYTDVSEYGWWYLIVSFWLMILIHDAYFYWSHRLMHHPKIFKHVHLVHHRSTNPTPWAAYSFHPFEAMIQAAVYYIFIFVFPVHGWVLLAFLTYMILRNVLGHLGIEFLPNWFIKNKWVNWHTTTTHHDLHHKRFHGNYGLYFTWWDNWFGTTNKNYKATFEEVTTREKSVTDLVPEAKAS